MALPDSIEFEYKLVMPENLERFSEMASICLGLNANSNYYKWKYLDNPAGKVIAFEAIHNGRPAAFYGVIPEFYSVDGQQVKIYQSMDTMTHPDYQKRGLFVKLANMTYDYVAQTEQRCDLVGIPGGNSFYGFVHKLNWKNIHNFSYFFLPRSWFRARNLIKRSSPAEVRPVAKMSAELSQPDDHEPSPKRISNLMSPEFFQWRVFQNPFKGFKVVEVFVGGSLIGVCVYTLDDQGRCLVHLLDFLKQSHYYEVRGRSAELAIYGRPAIHLYVGTT